jgi:hypothetical protein
VHELYEFRSSIYKLNYMILSVAWDLKGASIAFKEFSDAFFERIVQMPQLFILIRTGRAESMEVYALHYFLWCATYMLSTHSLRSSLLLFIFFKCICPISS